MLGGGAAPEGNHLCIGLPHPPGADTTRCKRDANFQCWNACSTCHDGLLAVVTSASQGAVLSGAVPPETRHQSQGVVVSVEYSSRTLPRCWQLCRKCNRAALGRPSLGMDDLTIRVHNTCLQPFTDQVEKGPVVDTHAQHVHQPRMVHMLEAAFDISLYQVAIPPVLEVKGEVADRIQRPPSGAIAVTTIQKILLIDCRQQLRTGQLHQFVFEGGNS